MAKASFTPEDRLTARKSGGVLFMFRMEGWTENGSIPWDDGEFAVLTDDQACDMTSAIRKALKKIRAAA
jgi:hypothetical protein